MYPHRKENVLQRYFAGLTEQTFESHLGVADPPMVDYLAKLLVRFLRSDMIFGVRDGEGKRLHDVAAMLSEAQKRTGEARRRTFRHIGDFALFWAGVYPEALGRLQGQNSPRHIIDYCTQGKRSYLIASSIDSAESGETEENPVLERLSQEFELCVYGLGEVRREWERRSPEDSPSVPWLFD